MIGILNLLRDFNQYLREYKWLTSDVAVPRDRPSLEELEKFVLNGVNNRTYSGESDADIVAWFGKFFRRHDSVRGGPSADSEYDDTSSPLRSRKGFCFAPYSRSSTWGSDAAAAFSRGGTPLRNIAFNPRDSVSPHRVMLRIQVHNDFLPAAQAQLSQATIGAGGIMQSNVYRPTRRSRGSRARRNTSSWGGPA